MSGDPSPVQATLTCLEIASTKISAAVAGSDGEHLVVLGAATSDRAPRAGADGGGRMPPASTPRQGEGLEPAVSDVLRRAWPSTVEGARTLVLTSSSLGVCRREHDVVLEIGGRCISPEDIAKLSQLAFEALPDDGERVLWCAPHEVRIDGVPVREDPVGRNAGRLSASMAIVSVAAQRLQGFGALLRETGWELADFIACPVASALGVTSPEERESGVAVIDLGARNAQLALYEGGALRHLSAIPGGIQGVIEAVAGELALPAEAARGLIRQHACALRWMVEAELLVEIGGARRIGGRVISDLVARALGQTFEVIARQLGPMVRGTGASCVLTGGGSRLGQLVEYTEEMLGMPTRAAHPRLDCAAPAWLNAPEHAALVGLLQGSWVLGTERTARTSLVTLASRGAALAVA